MHTLLHALLNVLLHTLFVEAFGKSTHGLGLVGIVALVFGPRIIVKRRVDVDEVQIFLKFWSWDMVLSRKNEKCRL